MRDMIAMYGMWHQMSQTRASTATSSDKKPDLAEDAKRHQRALEEICNSPFIKGYEAIAIARDALGIKPK